jgi:membrane protein required for colicin V production
MNLLDIGIVALCAVLALLGILRGIVRQAASLGGLILGHVVGVKYYAAVQKALGLEIAGGHVVAYLVALLAVYIAVRLVGLLVERWVRKTKLSGMDRFLGFLGGAFKGALLSVLLVFVLVILLPRNAPLLAGSKLAPRLTLAANRAKGVFPERFRESFGEKLGALETRPESAKEGGKGKKTIR